jgi:uncharacterized FlaG/YvyC family protein
MDEIKLYGLESLFDPQLTSEIKPELSRTNTINKASDIFEDIIDIVNELNHCLSRLNTLLHFSIEYEFDSFYIAVVDTKSNETVRRFPIEKITNKE